MVIMPQTSLPNGARPVVPPERSQRKEGNDGRVLPEAGSESDSGHRCLPLTRIDYGNDLRMHFDEVGTDMVLRKALRECSVISSPIESEMPRERPFPTAQILRVKNRAANHTT